MRKISAILWVALLAATAANPARAEAPKPAAVVSIAGYQKLLDAVNDGGRIAGVPIPLAPMIEAQIMQATHGKPLVGLDKSKPLGLVYLSDAKPDEPPLVFLPIADVKGLLALLPENVKHEEGANGVITIHGLAPKPAYLKGAGGWVFVASSANQLTDLPADPTKLLGDLPQRYAVAVRILPQNVPQEQRGKLIGSLRGLLQSFQGQFVGGDAGDSSIEQLKSFISQTNELTIGVSVDPAASKIVVEATATAMPGSQLAKLMPRFKDRATDFPGLRSAEAALSFVNRIEGALTPEELDDLKAKHAEALKRGIEAIDVQAPLDEASKPVAKEVLSSVLSVWFDTAKSGKRDGGVAVFMAPNPVAVVGAYVTDGDAIGVAVRKLAGLITGLNEKNSPIPPIKWEAETHRDHKFHVMQIPIGDPQAAAVLGDKVDIVLAVGKQSIWFAAGNGAVAKLKLTMDAPAAAGDAPAVTGVLRARPILDTAAKAAPPPAVAQIKMLSGQLAALKPGSDEVTLKSTPIDNGVTMRVEINEGILKTIAMAGMMAKAMNGPGGPLPDGPDGGPPRAIPIDPDKGFPPPDKGPPSGSEPKPGEAKFFDNSDRFEKSDKP